MNKHEHLLNALLYQATWFICMLNPDSYFGLLSAIITLSVHLSFRVKRLKEFAIIASMASMGYCMDLSMDLLGFLDTSHNSNSNLYLLIIWLVFACSLRSSFCFIFKKYQYALLLGALAPVSYYFGQKLDRVEYFSPLTISMSIHAFLWISLMTRFFVFSKKSHDPCLE